MLSLARRATVASLSLALAAALPAAPASAAAAACPDSIPDPGFVDVDDSNAHSDAITCVAWWEITTGDGLGTYVPMAEVRREHMATFIARLVESIGGDLPAYGKSNFKDVSDSSPHENNISRLADVGIVQGTSPEEFSPASTVTRAQMATFLVRAVEFARNQALPAGGDAFDDDNGNSHEENIDKVAAAGFAGGVGERRYDPSGVVRRDQMATFMARVLDRSVEAGDTYVPVEHVSFDTQGQGLSEPFRLRSSAEYRADYEFRDADCFYGQFLKPDDDDYRGYTLGGGMEPTAGSTTIPEVTAATTYRIEAFTGDSCAWSLTVTRVR